MVNALKQIRKRTKKSIEDEIENNEIDSIIKDNPITCACYYRNRISSLRNLICHENKYYGDVEECFFVTEFQNRGSKHDHALLWINNAPIFGKDIDCEIENFVGKYLSCDSSITTDELKTLHHHRHTKTCRKKKNMHCRFNFP